VTYYQSAVYTTEFRERIEKDSVIGVSLTTIINSIWPHRHNWQRSRGKSTIWKVA